MGLERECKLHFFGVVRSSAGLSGIRLCDAPLAAQAQ